MLHFLHHFVKLPWLDLKFLASASLVLAVCLTAACGGRTGGQPELVPVEVDQSPLPTANVHVTVVAKFDRTSSYRFLRQAIDTFSTQLSSVVAAGGCDIKVYPGFIQSDSYGSAAQLAPIVVPPCPSPPAVPLIRRPPPAGDSSSCNFFDGSCPTRTVQEADETKAIWAQERDAASSRYRDDVAQYELQVKAIQGTAQRKIENFRAAKVAVDSRGTDVTGGWISAGELLLGEGDRRLQLIVASDLQPDGYQTRGDLPSLANANVSVIFFECEDAAFCQQVRAQVPALLSTRIVFLTPAQSLAIAALFAFEVQ